MIRFVFFFFSLLADLTNGEINGFWGVGEYDDYSCDCQCGKGRTD